MNSKEKKPVMTEEDIMKLLDSCYEKCLNGIPKVSPSVEELANDYLKKHRTTEEACRAMLKNQIAKCTTSGVVTGFGGFITMPVAILANVGSVIYVQMRMIACVAYISNIFVKSLHSDQNIKQIQITDFQVGMDGICKLLYYNKGIKIKEYLLNISKMNYSNYSSVISLELNDISLVDEGYIAYSAAGHGFGNEYPRVYFSSGEKIIIKRKENL